MSKRKSVVWQIAKEELQQLIDNSNCITDVLKSLGLNAYNGNHRTLHERIKLDCLNTSMLENNRKVLQQKRLKLLSVTKTLTDEEVFCEHSRYSRNDLKKRIIKRNLLPYQCVECGNTGIHNSKSLSLQLDHINGVNDDNRLVNLRFLCPNCHSQTLTFGSKRLKGTGRKVYETPDAKQQRFLSMRRFNPSKEELEQIIKVMPMTQVGSHYGVSRHSIRRRCLSFGINLSNKFDNYGAKYSYQS